MNPVVTITLEPSRHYLHYRIPRNLSHEVRRINGIDTPQPGVMRLSREFYTEPMAVLACQLLVGLSVGTDPDPYELAEPGEDDERACVTLDASDSDLRIINKQHAVKSMKAEDVRIYDRYVVNDAPTRGMLWFTKTALDKLAVDFRQGRSRLVNHDKTRIIGRTFAAEVVKKKIRGLTANWVKVREYLPVTPMNAEHIHNRDNGTYAFDSIGFAGGKIDLVEKPVGDKTRYFLQIDYDVNDLPVLEAGEVSDVFLGNVFGAGNDKQQSAAVDIPAPVSSGDVSRLNHNPDAEKTWLFLT